jgi:putative ABC transport system ATP-binding protein
VVELTGLTRRFFAGTANEVNGAGKSTLLKAISGVVSLDAGRVVLDGRDVTGIPEHRRARLIGRIDQDPMGSTAPLMSLEENLAMAARRGRPRGLAPAVTAPKRAWFRELLAELELGLEDRLGVRVGTLSGGSVYGRRCDR